MSREVTYGLIIFTMLMVWLVGFSVIIGLDSYTDKKRKKLFGIIIIFVFLHIMQNFVEFWLMNYFSASLLRTFVSVFGYSIRPAILALFAHIIAPKKKHIPAWCLVGVNVIMHLTAFWTDLVFSIVDNSWRGGPLRHWCLITSAILLVYLLYLAGLKYKKEKAQAREIIFHLFWIFIIVAGIVADVFFNEKSNGWTISPFPWPASPFSVTFGSTKNSSSTTRMSLSPNKE